MTAAARVILDTDLAMGADGANIDDGFALALAVAEPGIHLELVTTVHGNTDVVSATRLTAELLDVLERTDLSVARGASGPLNPRWRRPDRELVTAADEVIGRPQAATEIARRVLDEPGQITVVAIGPLTNVALALHLEPRVAAAAREIVVMGGSYREGAHEGRMRVESNFWSDPDAAAVVLASGGRIRLVGLDVTSQVRLTRGDADALGRESGRFAGLASSTTLAWIDHLERVEARDEIEQESCAVHDPLAVAVVTRPDLVTWQPAHVTVETASEVTRGIAAADLLLGEDPPAPNCEIATSVDATVFRGYLLDRMSRLP